MLMYEVSAKCGHVGRNNYVNKTFAVKANNGKQAAEMVRWFPRVKHHHKDAIRYVNEITIERFHEIMEHNQQDCYFTCKNVQEQRAYIETNICSEKSVNYCKKVEVTNKCYYSGKTRIRNLKKYRNYYREDVRVSVC